MSQNPTYKTIPLSEHPISEIPQMKYILIENTYLQDFLRAVNRSLEQGGQLVGGVSITSHEIHIHYAQAMKIPIQR